MNAIQTPCSSDSVALSSSSAADSAQSQHLGNAIHGSPNLISQMRVGSPSFRLNNVADVKTFQISPDSGNYFAILFDKYLDEIKNIFLVEIIKVGGVTPHHHHSTSHEFFFVLHGEGVASCNGEEVALKKGDSLLLHPGTDHVVRNVGNTKLYTLTVMTPNEEFSEFMRSGESVTLDSEDLQVLCGKDRGFGMENQNSMVSEKTSNDCIDSEGASPAHPAKLVKPQPQYARSVATQTPAKSFPQLLSKTILPTKYGALDFQMWNTSVDLPDCPPFAVLLSRGKLGPDTKKLRLRLHDACATSEIFGSVKCDCAEQLEMAMEIVGKNEEHSDTATMVLYTYQEGRGIGLPTKIAAYELQRSRGLDTLDANLELGCPADARDYSFVKEMFFGNANESLNFNPSLQIHLLSNNPEKVEKLEAAGVAVAKRVPFVSENIAKDSYAGRYLEAKRQRMRHMLLEGEKGFVGVTDGGSEHVHSQHRHVHHGRCMHGHWHSHVVVKSMVEKVF